MLQQLGPGALADLHPAETAIAEGICHFKARGNSLMDCEGLSVKRCFGRLSEITIGANVRELNVDCFSGCPLAGVSFERGSKLARLGKRAFAYCSLLSICLPS
jgi:hypothetical protein